MSFSAEALDSFNALLEIMQEAAPTGCTIRWPVVRDGTDNTGAADYDVLPSPSPDKLELMAGGFLADYEFSMSARRDDFDKLPDSGTLLSRGGRISRILSVENSELSPTIVLHCGTPDR